MANSVLFDSKEAAKGMYGERFKDWTGLEIRKWNPYIVNTMEEKK